MAFSGRDQVKLRTKPTTPADDQEDLEDAGAEGLDPGEPGNHAMAARPRTLGAGAGVLVVVFMPGAPLSTRLGPVRF